MRPQSGVRISGNWHFIVRELVKIKMKSFHELSEVVSFVICEKKTSLHHFEMPLIWPRLEFSNIRLHRNIKFVTDINWCIWPTVFDHNAEYYSDISTSVLTHSARVFWFSYILSRTNCASKIVFSIFHSLFLLTACKKSPEKKYTYMI